MTSAPSDLLSLRSKLESRLGLSAVEVGIVGDSRHAANGGYHEGRDDLTRAGVVNSDYSTRLQRDKAGLTNSASAMDIGYGWNQGHAAWLRFNNLLVAALHANDPALSSIRAVNYSPDGSAKKRTDRENGWRVESSSDSVNIHTHIEWYRDTEGKRQASFDRILALVDQAIGGVTAPSRPAPSKPAALVVDGKLGPHTIKRWQQIMGTPADGKISDPSELVKAVQRKLNSAIHAGLVVDGRGIAQNDRVYHTARALQKYLGTQQDGKLSSPVSECVKALQRRLNEGRF